MTRWVLLRGLTREAGHWGDFPAVLRARSGHAACCLDLPGCGELWRERSPANVRDIARGVLERLEPHRGPTVVLALSLGAMVALEMARLAPGVVSGCVLVNASAGSVSPFHERLQPRNYPHLLRMALPGGPLMQRQARVLAATSARAHEHEQLLPRWSRLAAEHPVSATNALRQLWAAAQFRPGVRPGVPLLLLASRGDTLVAPACSRRLATHWDVPLREHAWAGHDLPLDDGAWVIEQALAWWKDVAR